MLNDNENKENNKSPWWRFVKIKYQKYEQENKKVIIVPTCNIALQVGNKFYLDRNKIIYRTKKRHVQILKRFDYIPSDANKGIIEKYVKHLCNLQNKTEQE